MCEKSVIVLSHSNVIVEDVGAFGNIAGLTPLYSSLRGCCSSC